MNATQITTAGNTTPRRRPPVHPSGKAVANVRIAVNYRIRQDEAWVEGEPTFDDVTLWEKAVENAAESLRKEADVVTLYHQRLAVPLCDSGLNVVVNRPPFNDRKWMGRFKASLDPA
jgi:hypothetical protein